MKLLKNYNCLNFKLYPCGELRNGATGKEESPDKHVCFLIFSNFKGGKNDNKV